MPTATIAGVDVAVNDEGFFEQPDQWTEAHGRRDRTPSRASTP